MKCWSNHRQREYWDLPTSTIWQKGTLESRAQREKRKTKPQHKTTASFSCNPSLLLPLLVSITCNPLIELREAKGWDRKNQRSRDLKRLPLAGTTATTTVAAPDLWDDLWTRQAVEFNDIIRGRTLFNSSYSAFLRTLADCSYYYRLLSLVFSESGVRHLIMGHRTLAFTTPASFLWNDRFGLVTTMSRHQNEDEIKV